MSPIKHNASIALILFMGFCLAIESYAINPEKHDIISDNSSVVVKDIYFGRENTKDTNTQDKKITPSDQYEIKADIHPASRHKKYVKKR